MNQEIIKLAIEGGYKSFEIDKCTIWFIHENQTDGKEDCLCIDSTYSMPYEDERKGIVKHYSREEILLDKEFWIALGKSLGWIFYADLKVGQEVRDAQIEGQEQWKHYAYQFLDARFEGREQEFFKELIEKR